MKTRYEVMLDGIALSSIDESVMITDISYTAPSVTAQNVTLAGRDGQMILSKQTEQIGVFVMFEIHEQSIARRMNVLSRVQEWALAGGMLTTSDRTDMQIRVVCDTPPYIASSMRFTETLEISFVSEVLPFWEDMYPVIVTMSGNSEQNVYAPGMARDCMIACRITNTGDEAITNVKIACGKKHFEFCNLNMAGGEVLEIGYDERGFLTAKCGSESVLSKRTAESDDDLTLPASKFGIISVETDTGAQQATFELRGLWI